MTNNTWRLILYDTDLSIHPQIEEMLFYVSFVIFLISWMHLWVGTVASSSIPVWLGVPCERRSRDAARWKRGRRREEKKKCIHIRPEREETREKRRGNVGRQRDSCHSGSTFLALVMAFVVTRKCTGERSNNDLEQLSDPVEEKNIEQVTSNRRSNKK